MRSIRTVTMIAAAAFALAASPAFADAGRVDWHRTCDRVSHGGYEAINIYDKNLGCDVAHRFVRHLVDHGPNSLHHLSCDVTAKAGSTFISGFFGYGTALYRCSGRMATMDSHEPYVEVALKFELTAD